MLTSKETLLPAAVPAGDNSIDFDLSK